MISLMLIIIEVVAVTGCMLTMLYIIKNQAKKIEYYQDQLDYSQKHNVKLLKAINERSGS